MMSQPLLSYRLLCCLFLALGSLFFTQENAAQGLAGQRNSDKAFLINLGYGRQFTGGDLSNRFGDAWAIDGGLDFLGKNSNWAYGVFGQYAFGSVVKEDVLANLRTEDGFIIGSQRDPADIQLRMRSSVFGARVSKIFSLSDQNPRSGIKVSFGAGWMEHRIRIQDDVVQTINQLVGDYRKGYDRLSSGPALYQFLGYQNLSVNGRVNFYGGVEAIQGFTTNKRDVDFATEGKLEENRLDVLLGVRVGLIIPIYRGEGKEIFYR